jgi:hypothetical protein
MHQAVNRAASHLLHSLFNELYIYPRALLCLLQVGHSHLGLLPLLGGKLQRAVVAMVALVVVKVSVQFGLGPLHSGVRSEGGIVLIALVVPPCVLAMLRPVAHANPAELESTHLAVHVVTALVFLYAAIALGALLGIGQDPVGCLRLALALLLPGREHVAGGGVVGLLSTAKTKGYATCAHHCRDSRTNCHPARHTSTHLVTAYAKHTYM